MTKANGYRLYKLFHTIPEKMDEKQVKEQLIKVAEKYNMSYDHLILEYEVKLMKSRIG